MTFLLLLHQPTDLVLGFLSVVIPTTVLLKKTPFQWTTVTQEAFSHHDVAFTSTPVLLCPDPTQPFIVQSRVFKPNNKLFYHNKGQVYSINVQFISAVYSSETHSKLGPGDFVLFILSTLKKGGISENSIGLYSTISNDRSFMNCLGSCQGHWTLVIFLLQICSCLLNEKADILTHWDQNQGILNSS